MSRLIAESVLIDKESNLNSKSEWRSTKMSRLVIETPKWLERKTQVKKKELSVDDDLSEMIDNLKKKTESVNVKPSESYAGVDLNVIGPCEDERTTVDLPVDGEVGLHTVGILPKKKSKSIKRPYGEEEKNPGRQLLSWNVNKKRRLESNISYVDVGLASNISYVDVGKNTLGGRPRSDIAERKKEPCRRDKDTGKERKKSNKRTTRKGKVVSDGKKFINTSNQRLIKDWLVFGKENDSAREEDGERGCREDKDSSGGGDKVSSLTSSVEHDCDCVVNSEETEITVSKTCCCCRLVPYTMAKDRKEETTEEERELASVTEEEGRVAPGDEAVAGPSREAEAETDSTQVQSKKTKRKKGKFIARALKSRLRARLEEERAVGLSESSNSDTDSVLEFDELSSSILGEVINLMDDESGMIIDEEVAGPIPAGSPPDSANSSGSTTDMDINIDKAILNLLDDEKRYSTVLEVDEDIIREVVRRTTETAERSMRWGANELGGPGTLKKVWLLLKEGKKLRGVKRAADESAHSDLSYPDTKMNRRQKKRKVSLNLSDTFDKINSMKLSASESTSDEDVEVLREPMGEESFEICEVREVSWDNLDIPDLTESEGSEADFDTSGDYEECTEMLGEEVQSVQLNLTEMHEESYVDDVRRMDLMEDRFLQRLDTTGNSSGNGRLLEECGSTRSVRLRRVEQWEVESLVRCSEWRVVVDNNGHDTGLEVAEFEQNENLYNLDSSDGLSNDENFGECSIAPSGQGNELGLLLIDENFGGSSINGAQHDTSEHSLFEENFGESSINGARHDTSQHSVFEQNLGESSISPNGQENLDSLNSDSSNLDSLKDDLELELEEENGIRVAYSDAELEGGSQTASIADDPLDTCLIVDENNDDFSDEDMVDELQAVAAGVTTDDFRKHC